MTQKIQTAGAVTLTMAYGYDAGGRLASVAYPSGMQIVYAYDAAGRVSSATANGQPLITGVNYLPFGMASGWTAGSGGAYQRTVDQDGRITGLALPASGNIALSYDAASRITGLAETGLLPDNYDRDLPYPGVCRPNNYVPSRPLTIEHINCWLACAEDPADPASP